MIFTSPIFIIPFIIVTVLGPKLFASDSINYASFKKSTVMRKHVILGILVAGIPIINIVLSIMGLAMYGYITFTALDAPGSWINQPLFKRKQ